MRFPQLNYALNNTPQCRHDTAPGGSAVTSVSGGRPRAVQPLNAPKPQLHPTSVCVHTTQLNTTTSMLVMVPCGAAQIAVLQRNEKLARAIGTLCVAHRLNKMGLNCGFVGVFTNTKGATTPPFSSLLSPSSCLLSLLLSLPPWLARHT